VQRRVIGGLLKQLALMSPREEKPVITDEEAAMLRRESISYAFCVNVTLSWVVSTCYCCHEFFKHQRAGPAHDVTRWKRALAHVFYSYELEHLYLEQD
jgi:hypothetical protein